MAQIGRMGNNCLGPSALIFLPISVFGSHLTQVIRALEKPGNVDAKSRLATLKRAA
jgi:hypothetical protein